MVQFYLSKLSRLHHGGRFALRPRTDLAAPSTLESKTPNPADALRPIICISVYHTRRSLPSRFPSRSWRRTARPPRPRRRRRRRWRKRLRKRDPGLTKIPRRRRLLPLRLPPPPAAVERKMRQPSSRRSRSSAFRGDSRIRMNQI